MALCYLYCVFGPLKCVGFGLGAGLIDCCVSVGERGAFGRLLSEARGLADLLLARSAGAMGNEMHGLEDTGS